MSSIFYKVKPQLGVIKENIWERKNICFLVHSICIYFLLCIFPDVFVCFCSIFAPWSRLSLKSDYSLRRQAERIYHFAFFTFTFTLPFCFFHFHFLWKLIILCGGKLREFTILLCSQKTDGWVDGWMDGWCILTRSRTQKHIWNIQEHIGFCIFI